MMGVKHSARSAHPADMITVVSQTLQQTRAAWLRSQLERGREGNREAANATGRWHRFVFSSRGADGKHLPAPHCTVSTGRDHIKGKKKKKRCSRLLVLKSARKEIG